MTKTLGEWLINLLMGDATIFQTIVFYIVATLDFVGCMSVWLFRSKPWRDKLLLTYIVLIECCYTIIVCATLGLEPMLLLNMSFSGVQRQFRTLWVMVSSVGHFAVTDIIASRVVLFLMETKHMAEGKYAYYYIPLYILLFLWAPIGLLIFAVIFLLTKGKEKTNGTSTTEPLTRSAQT